MKKLLFASAVTLVAALPGASIAAAGPSITRPGVSIAAAGPAITRTGASTTTGANNVRTDNDFTASLTAKQEVQVPPVVSHATGMASFHLTADGTKLHFRLSAHGLGRITMAHIHLGATGVNGPAVAFLFPETTTGVNGDGFEVEGTITAVDLVGPLAGQTNLDQLVQALRAGSAYANIHTTGNPGGEIRGQIYGNIVFTTLDNQADPTFNQLLGVNNNGVIAGYFGSGASGHPNQGFTLSAPYAQANYSTENFPGSAQTQVIGINGKGDTAGFWVDGNGATRGFVEWNGIFASFVNPRSPHGAGQVNQLLGINNAGIAVGFYNGANGKSHAYTLNQASGVFTPISPPGAVSAQATGINRNGDIVGLAVSATGTTQGWLLKDSRFSEFDFPGSTNTQAFGVNNRDQIVGSYVDAAGNTHGFVLSNPTSHSSWRSLDDPNGVGTTTINGLNDDGAMVGFYTDTAGNTHGMLATVGSASH